jgi:hypothetical protein
VVSDRKDAGKRRISSAILAENQRAACESGVRRWNRLLESADILDKCYFCVRLPRPVLPAEHQEAPPPGIRQLKSGASCIQLT